MRVIETKVYTFDELSDDAKQKAINSLNGINVDHNWWEFIYGDAEEIGLKITSFDLDRNRHADGHFTLSAAEVMANIFANYGEDCRAHKTAKAFEEDWQPLFNEYMDESSDKYEDSETECDLNDLEFDFLKSLLEDYSIILKNGYEYLQSDESVIESIVANQYEFTEKGELI